MWKPIIAILILLVSPTLAGMQCKVTQACPTGWLSVMKMSSDNNSHAAFWNDPDYNYSVCCINEPSELTRECGEKSVTLARISSSANAHIEQGTLSNYITRICLTDTHNSLFASYKGSCGESETCAFSISDITNAHSAACGLYAINICISTTPTHAGDAATGGAGGGTGFFIPTPMPAPTPSPTPSSSIIPGTIVIPQQQNQSKETIIQKVMQIGKTPIQNTSIPWGIPIMASITIIYVTAKTIMKMNKINRRVKK